MPVKNSNATIRKIYTCKNKAFSIGADEIATIEESGGNSTYGEITDKGVQMLIHELNPKKSDVFYDLGSGGGRMVLKMYLDSPIHRAVGIELSPTRHAIALKAQEKLKELGQEISGKILEFRNADIQKARIQDATIIYVASTCFSDEFMQKLTTKLAALKKGLNVLTLRQLPKHEAFTLVKELRVPMTWGADVSVYWYTLTNGI